MFNTLVDKIKVILPTYFVLRIIINLYMERKKPEKILRNT